MSVVGIYCIPKDARWVSKCIIQANSHTKACNGHIERRLLATVKLVAALAMSILNAGVYFPVKTALCFSFAMLSFPWTGGKFFTRAKEGLISLIQSVSLCFQLTFSIPFVPLVPEVIQSEFPVDSVKKKAPNPKLSTKAAAKPPPSKKWVSAEGKGGGGLSKKPSTKISTAAPNLKSHEKGATKTSARGYHSHQYNKEIFAELQAAVEKGSYEKSIKTMRQGTKIYIPGKLEKRPLCNRATISVQNRDTMELGAELADKNPALLNMANAYTPGGGVLQGSSAQEEELCRRSTLYFSLIDQKKAQKKQYIPEFGCIYSPHVEIVRTRQPNGAFTELATQNNPKVSIISSAAYNLKKQPHVENLEKKTKRKILAQLRAAIDHGHEVIVLGAFGCGAFHNNPDRIAKWYRDILIEKGYQKYFTEIHFAVLAPRQPGKASTNFTVFQKAFSH